MRGFSLSGVNGVVMTGWGKGDRALGGGEDYLLRRTRDTLSHADMSEMITLSPTARPLSTSTVFTDARPSFTVTRVASLPSSLTLNRPTLLSAEPYAGLPTYFVFGIRSISMVPSTLMSERAPLGS